MIVVNGSTDKITIEGHAHYAEPGKDIVCAGISALTQTLIHSIETLTEDTITYEIKSGYVDIKFWTLSEQARVLMESFFVGANLIADEYPENVRIDQALKS